MSQRPPRLRPETPRKEHGRQQWQVPPETATVREAFRHAPGRLPDKDCALVLRPSGHAGRNRPEQCTTSAQRHGTQQRQIPRDPIPAGARRSPPWRRQRHRQHVHQDHRAFGQHTERDGECEVAHTSRLRMLHRQEHAEHAKQRSTGEQRVEHEEGAERCPDQGAGRDQRRPSARTRIQRPDRMRQRGGHAQRDDTRQRPDETRPDFADAEQLPAACHEPEEQRRLVAVGPAVQVRHQPVVALQHLERDGRIARLVDRHQRTGDQSDDGHERDEQRAHGRAATARCGGFVHGHDVLNARCARRTVSRRRRSCRRDAGAGSASGCARRPAVRWPVPR